MVSDASDGSDGMEWEDVTGAINADTPIAQVREPGDVILDNIDFAPPSIEVRAGRQKGKKLDDKERERLNAERVARLESHKLHTIALLANASIRNKWVNDKLLHARLMSLTPLSLQNGFLMISRKLQPDPARRGRQFESAILRLAHWWHDNFSVDSRPERNVRSRTFMEVQQELNLKGWNVTGLSAKKTDPKGKGKAKDVEVDEEEIGETIRSSKSLMKHALMMRGSRDTSAQLFTALCRALDVPARLVVSIQAVPWKSSVGKKTTTTKTKKSAKGKEKEENEVVSSENDTDEEEFDTVVLPPSTPSEASTDHGKSKGLRKDTDDRFPGSGYSLKDGPSSRQSNDARPPKVVNLRKSKPLGHRLGDLRLHRHHDHPPIGGWPPVFWTEVFSKPDGRWIPVDPIRNLINKKRLFEPPPNDRNNRMLYVFGFEEDGYGRDVTSRYAKEFGAKTAKLRPAGTRGKRDWWDGVTKLLARPYRLNRDDTEDAELVTSQISEGMPASVSGFKDHPLYVLERHLRRDEVIYPHNEIGKFRGEPVFSRANVVSLKTSENWMRQGKEVKEGNQPLKWVKVRAVTISKKRAVEMAGEGGEDVLQGLYADWQTKKYVSPPVYDGKVPKNDFGNIDLYVPSMLPAGGVHLAFKGIAKVARKLGIDYAEAVTGFEFKKRKALPILTGVVIPMEHEAELLEAYWETAQAAEEKEMQKRQARVIQRWSRLVTGLRIRERLMKQYSDKSTALGAGIAPKQDEDTSHAPDINEGGGFLLNEHGIDVVQPYSMPKPQRLVPPMSISENLRNSKGTHSMDNESEHEGIVEDRFEEWDGDNNDGFDPTDGFDALDLDGHRDKGAPPKTMAELADETEAMTEGDEVAKQGDNQAKRITRSAARPSVVVDIPRRVRGATATNDRPKRSTFSKDTQVAPTPKRPRRSSNQTRRRQKSSGTSASSDQAEDSSLTDDEESKKTPAKRQRVAEKEDIGVVSSARTLRPRKGKTAVQLQEEQAMERAFRRAIAD